MPEGQLTQEDLGNMTPEQIAELQKQNCIFCHIISGKVASKKVFEDDKCLAILDINPANPGHVLLMPKEHYAIMPLMPEDIIGHLFMVAKGISHACLKAFKAQGTNIFVANGVAAGQKAQHFMLHVIPRKDKDGLACFALPKKKITEQQLEELRKVLKARLDFVMGVKGSGKQSEEEGKEEKPAAAEEEAEAEITEEKKEEEETESGEKEDEDDSGEEEAEEKEESKQGIDLDRIAELLGNSLGGSKK